MSECELGIGCDEPATTTVPDPAGDIPACRACANAWHDCEPDDFAIYNGPGIEGGVRYGHDAKPR